MKKYMATTGYYPRVEVVECERETASCVFIKGRKANKKTDYESYFDDFDSAKNHVVVYFSNKVDEAKRNLKYWQDKFGNAVGIKNQDRAVDTAEASEQQTTAV